MGDRKFEPRYYMIMRELNGDHFARFWHSSCIGAGGGGLAYNAIGVHVSPQWQRLDEKRHSKVIEKIKNSSEVPIVLWYENIDDYDGLCLLRLANNEIDKKKMEINLKNCGKEGFFNKIRRWYYTQKLERLKSYPTVNEVISDVEFPTYSVSHPILHFDKFQYHKPMK